MATRLFDTFQNLILKLILRLIWILPEDFMRGLACLIGWALAGLLRSRRRIMEENLRIAFGTDLNHDRMIHICQQAWMNLILTAMEVLRFPRWGERYLAEIHAEGVEHAERSVSAGRGMVAVVPHLGNWEIGGAWFARRFPFAVIARPLNQEGVAQVLDDIRAQMGVTVFPRKSALKNVLAFLRRGGTVAFMLDQHASKHNVVVPFFGRPVKTFSSAAALALRTGAAVHLGYIWRRPDRNLGLRICPPISLPQSGNFERDVREATVQYTAAIEAVVREHPDCWLWMHRRWRPVNHKQDACATLAHGK
ncbi:MAG: lysophospholipid acyltransferase family protein [bacterium]